MKISQETKENILLLVYVLFLLGSLFFLTRSLINDEDGSSNYYDLVLKAPNPNK